MSNSLIVDSFVKDRVLVYLKKNKDYGDSFLISLRKFGNTSALVRMDDKVNRYLQLTTANTKAEVNDESVQDTLLDLFNYMMMYETYLIDTNYILLSDLVECMLEETKIILFEDVKDSFIYKVLTEDLKVLPDNATKIITKLRELI